MNMMSYVAGVVGIPEPRSSSSGACHGLSGAELSPLEVRATGHTACNTLTQMMSGLEALAYCKRALRKRSKKLQQTLLKIISVCILRAWYPICALPSLPRHTSSRHPCL